MIIVDVIFRSATGESILLKEPSEDRNFTRYAATKETQDEAVKALTGLGFELVGPPSQYGVSISGPSQLVHEVFGDEPFTVPRSLAKWVEAVRIPPPVEFYGKGLE
ncbi:MAG TPA: hypothetical protein HA261_04295 [Methanosarcina sp.]|nr:hypothetical protein [Methanosarcina sp.]